MLFNTFDFLLFLLVVLPVQWVLPHRARNVFLLAASYFFYACWDWRFVGLLALSTTVDWTLANLIAREPSRERARRWVATSVTVNLLFLGFFKYFNFFVDSAAALVRGLGADPSSLHLHVVLPVGISFYTFQSISYIVDVYRKEVEPARNPIDFALFVAFFPHMVAGPIMHSRDLLPQMLRKTRPTGAAVRLALWLILWGLFKKAVVADNLAPLADAAFAPGAHPLGGEVLLGVYAFAFQIYADFSGYTDIARGVAKLMGYELMLNFRLPYFATNPQEFWRRWHVSLSTWLRDYLYIPLGGSRGSEARTRVNLMLTMLLGGLWHGAAWTFVMWGGYQGLLLVGHRALFGPRPRDGAPGTEPGVVDGLWWMLRVAVMFHLACLGWLIFRAGSVAQLVAMAGALVTSPHFTAGSAAVARQLCAYAGPLLALDVLQGASGDLALPARLPLLLRVPLYAGLALLVLTLGVFGSRAFIYFQF